MATRAYAPFSRYQVGAALLGQSGRIYTGCNVENSSYGLTICAERTAVVKGISEGEKSFRSLAVVCSGKELAFPCGACLQVLNEFCGELSVVLACSCGQKLRSGLRTSLRKLLPRGFRLRRSGRP